MDYSLAEFALNFKTNLAVDHKTCRRTFKHTKGATTHRHPSCSSTMPPAAAVSSMWRTDGPVSKGTEKDAVGVQHIEQTEDDSTLKTVDECLRRRARTDPDLPVVSYPSSGIEYVDYTFQQLDVFAYRVGKQLQAAIPSRTSSAEKRTVVAMLGPSNLEYLVTMMGLLKLGHTVLFLSTRISVPAIESLINSTGAAYLIADPRYLEASLSTKELVPELQVLEMPTRSNFEFPIDAVGDTQLDAALDPSIEINQIVYIIHSSGMKKKPKDAVIIQSDSEFTTNRH